MIKYGVYALLCITLFAAAYAGTHVMRKRLAESEPDSSKESGWAPPPASSPIVDTMPRGQTVPNAEELPVAVRPRPMSTEEVIRLGESLREREQAVRSQQEALENERKQLKLVEQDIVAERKDLEDLRNDIRKEIELAEQLNSALTQRDQAIQQQREQARNELAEIEKTRVKYEAEEQSNLKTISAWFQNMEPSAAANYLKQLTTNGKLDLAVQLLAGFQERDAAEIIEQMDDPQLVTEIAEKFRSMSQPSTGAVRK